MGFVLKVYVWVSEFNNIDSLIKRLETQLHFEKQFKDTYIGSNILFLTILLI